MVREILKLGTVIQKKSHGNGREMFAVTVLSYSILYKGIPGFGFTSQTRSQEVGKKRPKRDIGLWGLVAWILEQLTDQI